MDTTELLDRLRAKSKDWFVLGVSCVGVESGNILHFVSRIQACDGSTWDIHTRTGYDPSTGRANSEEPAFD